MDTKSDRDNPFPGIGKYSRQAKGEAAVHLSGTAARFVIQTLLGFTFRTYTTVLVLPSAKFSYRVEVFYLFLQLGFASSSI